MNKIIKILIDLLPDGSIFYSAYDLFGERVLLSIFFLVIGYDSIRKTHYCFITFNSDQERVMDWIQFRNIDRVSIRMEPRNEFFIEPTLEASEAIKLLACAKGDPRLKFIHHEVAAGDTCLYLD